MGASCSRCVSEAISKVVPVESLRWISFGHVESDECGSMNDWLARAPQATVAQSVIGCMVSINDLADRPPRPLADGEVLDIGGHRMRWIDTPHVPHGWEAGVLYDETTTHAALRRPLHPAGCVRGLQRRRRRGSRRSPPRTSTGALSLSPKTGGILRGLADLDIDTLALMHGPAYSGDCSKALLELADDVERRIAAAA